MTEEEQKAIEELKKDLDIEIKECSSSNDYRHLSGLYLNGNVETILNLISKLQSDIEIKDKVIKELENKLEEHIKFCEQESRGHLENKVCHISLKFEKNLLEEVEKVRDNLQEENE